MNEQEKNDLLIRMDANLQNMTGWFKAHLEADVVAFEKQDKRIKNLEKVFWCGIGALGLLELVVLVTK